MEYYTLQTVMMHNNTESCWIVVDNKVYDITSYLKRNLHPGGDEVFLKYAGTDATNSFSDIHSKDAWNILEEYYIGNVKKDEPFFLTKLFKYFY
jgi:cytochrome b involved in lipid metabolism